jgi:hypothetical protein
MKDNELQSNGQIIDPENLSHRVKKVSSEGVFMSVSKKAEKITTALYMLTDLIKEGDPMRHKIREVSLMVLSDTRGLSHAMTGDLYFHLARVIARSWELMSFIDVCVVVGFISDMNHGILKNALVEFIGDLRNRQRIEGFSNMQDMKLVQGSAANFRLKSDFFNVSEKDIASTQEEMNPVKDNSYKGHSSRTFYKGQMSFIKNQKQPLVDKNKPFSDTSTERISKIFDLIKEKKDININDIMTYFSDYSKKTIQRDLINLIEEGKIKKTGDRRWSRYSV